MFYDISTPGSWHWIKSRGTSTAVRFTRGLSQTRLNFKLDLFGFLFHFFHQAAQKTKIRFDASFGFSDLGGSEAGHRKFPPTWVEKVFC